MTATPARSIRIAILAMGGEGGGVLADWIVGAAEAKGYRAQLTSVPGVAQRTGATNYYIELFPGGGLPAGLEPVMALTPFPGDIDIVVASELMEAGRAIQRGLVTPDRTTLVTSTARVFAMTERLAMADGRVDTEKLLEACRLAARRLVAVDMGAIAERTGSVISAAMLGALAGARALPFERTDFEAAIERGGVGVSASKRAFAAALDATAPEPAAAAPPAATDGPPIPASLGRLQAEAAARLPAPAHEFVREGVARLLDYQDEAYARLYLDRLQRIAETDRAAGDGSFRLTAETARWLALGMSYEDTIRVAELKIRASRFERVRAEVGARDGQIVQIAEFLHPRLQEIAESVPAPLGRFLQRNWLARRLIGAMTASGKIVDTTSIRGFLLMSAVASLKPRRRSSLRFAEETRTLEAWLEDVAAFAPRDYAMALEIAELRRLVKGYGDTHQRGRKRYAAIIACARRMQPGPDAAAHIAMLRRAALDDETGAKLDAMLAHMAPGTAQPEKR
jgi:indolepyruvate ferredoxin oxidoreductase beta subunit